MAWSNAQLTLYHGTIHAHAQDIRNNGVELVNNRPLDFGTGFYTTTSFSQACKWAVTVSRLSKLSLLPEQDRKPVVLTFLIDRDELAKFALLGFVRPTSDYWDLVSHCRRSCDNTNRAISTWYDVCFGPVALKWDSELICKGDSDQVSFHTMQVIKKLLVSPEIGDVP